MSALRYHITLAPGTLQRRAGWTDVVTSTLDAGHVVGTTSGYDVEGHDLALIDIPDSHEASLDDFLEEDEDVVYYRMFEEE